jgi:hypothetical protein
MRKLTKAIGFHAKYFYCNSNLDEMSGSVLCWIQYFNTTFVMHHLPNLYKLDFVKILGPVSSVILSSRQYLSLSCVNNILPVTEKVSVTSSNVGMLYVDCFCWHYL